MKLAYGAIKGNNTYLLGITKDDHSARLNYGYIMEKLVLKATELGLSTCWVGYFDHEYFSDLKIQKGFVIPGLVVIGYAAEKRSLPEKLMRYAVSASQRLPWERLFFDFQTKDPLNTIRDQENLNELNTIVEQYKESLEMVRLAPSASNTQPWRIFVDCIRKEFHFFKKPKNKIYENMGMHELDIGIAMAHFELTSQNNGLNGSWISYSDKPLLGRAKMESKEETKEYDFSDLQYMVSWKISTTS